LPSSPASPSDDSTGVSRRRKIRRLRLPVIRTVISTVRRIIRCSSPALLLITTALTPATTFATASIVLAVAIGFSLLFVRTRCLCVLAIRIIVICTIAALLILLGLLLLLLLLVERLGRCHNPQIVLGVLEIVFSVHIVTRRNRIARQLQILVCDRLRISANLYVWTVALIDPVERIGLPPTTAAATSAAATASGPVLVMLSLSHAVSSPGLFNNSFDFKKTLNRPARHLPLPDTLLQEAQGPAVDCLR
jgi:hypothetical protein